MSPLVHSTISEYLNAEFSRRKERNGAYSLRAFARDLEMSPSRLSEVLKGKQGLSESTVETVALKLARKARDRAFIRDLVLAESSRNPTVREAAQERLSKVRQTEKLQRLKEEQFRVIADWYHAAILELTQVEDFEPSFEWVAKRLGISPATVEGALSRLVGLGLMRVVNGKWVAQPEVYSTFSDVPSAANRKFHRQIMVMHGESLFADPMSERELNSMILAIPRARLEEFRLEMRQFMSQFVSRLEKEKKDDLYSMTIQLCPVRPRV